MAVHLPDGGKDIHGERRHRHADGTMIQELEKDLRVASLVGESTSHLVVRNGRGLLVDCHSASLSRWLGRLGLPMPEMILHTQVQPEHCRESSQFPGARILVHEALLELAADPAAYEKAAHTLWDNPAGWMQVLGREKYSVAGCINVFPPETPLNVAGTFREGDRIGWQDLVFEAIALPGHGRHQTGFVMEMGGRPLAVFTGDLLCHRARLVNLYDLEIHYGGTTLPSLPGILRDLARRPVRPYFPATGLPLADGPDQALELAGAIDDYHAALRWQSGGFHAIPLPDYPRVGRYRKLHRGIYQIDNLGNCIVLVDDRGRGLMFDPGPCDYELPGRVARFHGDLDVLERECGLQTMDLALITHMHGDHYDMALELRKRYPGCRVATSERVAPVIEAPWDYSYPGLLPWYNLGFDHVTVDEVLAEGGTYQWHDTAIRCIHLPGHCNRHAGYLLAFNGLRLAITGDTIQSRGEPGGMQFIISNHSVPDGNSGILKTYRQLAHEAVDLNIGAHGSRFGECGAWYRESLARAEHALPYLRRLVPDGDLERAFCRKNV